MTAPGFVFKVVMPSAHTLASRGALNRPQRSLMAFSACCYKQSGLFHFSHQRLSSQIEKFPHNNPPRSPCSRTVELVRCATEVSSLKLRGLGPRDVRSQISATCKQHSLDRDNHLKPRDVMNQVSAIYNRTRLIETKGFRT
jgi:hypothetical protein